jgi:signal transduction histidine kinase
VEINIPAPSGAPWILELSCYRVTWNGSPAVQWIGRDVTDRRAQRGEVVAQGPQLPLGLVAPAAEGLRHPAAQIEVAARHALDHPDRPWREQRDALEQIQELGDRVRCISEDLLFLVRLTDGSLDIRRAETQVGNVLAGLVPRLQRRARGSGGDVMVVHADESATLFTDARLLSHALRRFADRSLDTAGATVTITAAQDGDCVRLVLIDSAHALEPEVLSMLVAPDSLRRLAEGDHVAAGWLSLLLAVHLFRAIGGHVEIQSSPGMGTRTSLTLLS